MFLLLFWNVYLLLFHCIKIKKPFKICNFFFRLNLRCWLELSKKIRLLLSLLQRCLLLRCSHIHAAKKRRLLRLILSTRKPKTVNTEVNIILWLLCRRLTKYRVLLCKIWILNLSEWLKSRLLPKSLSIKLSLLRAKYLRWSLLHLLNAKRLMRHLICKLLLCDRHLLLLLQNWNLLLLLNWHLLICESKSVNSRLLSHTCLKILKLRLL